MVTDGGASRSEIDGRWQFEGETAVLHFVAFQMRMTTLAAVIILIVLPGGALVAAALIGLDMAGSPVPGRAGAVFFGALVAIPLCIGIFLVFRAMASNKVVRISPDGVEICSDKTRQLIPLSSIRLLRWRCSTDYARLVLNGEGANVSLLAGLRAPRFNNDGGTILPPLPEQSVRLLVNSGLLASSSRRAPDMVTFRRPSRQS